MNTKKEEKDLRRQERALEDVKELVSHKTFNFLQAMSKHRKVYYTDVRKYFKNKRSYCCPVCKTTWDYILSSHTCYFCKPQYEDNPDLNPAYFIPEMFRLGEYTNVGYYGSDGNLTIWDNNFFKNNN